MHVQQRSEDLAQAVPGSTHAAPSPKCCTASPAASMQRTMMQLGSSVLCQAPCLKPGLVPPIREDREQGMHKTQGMIQCSHWGSVEEMPLAKDRSPALNSYKHRVPAPHHSCIPATPMCTRSILPWPASPSLATGASADLTAALSCHDAWLAVAATCISQQECCEQRQQGTAQQDCGCPAAPRGKGRQGQQAPRAGLVCHKAAQLALVDEGDSSAQTPHKCYPLPRAVLDKDHPSAVEPSTTRSNNPVALSLGTIYQRTQDAVTTVAAPGAVAAVEH